MSWDNVQYEVELLFSQPNFWAQMETGLHEERTYNLDGKATAAREARVTKRQQHAPCPGCNKPFDPRPNGWVRKFCSDACRKQVHNKALTEKRRAAAPPREKPCSGCGKLFTFKTNKARWCSRKCRP